MTGDELLLMRRKANVSQLELGQAIGYSRQAIAKWERGTHAIPSKVIPAIMAACTKPAGKTSNADDTMARATFEAYAQMRNRDHFSHQSVMAHWAKHNFIPNPQAVALILEAFPDARTAQ